MLLGREPELLAIDQALAAARLGTSSRLLIRGEPGIGKTALLEHAVSQAAPMRVLAARGVEFEADVPFAGLHELLHPTLVLLDRLPQRHAAALRSSLGLGPRIEADRLIIGAAALGLISAYAEERPLLITVDDAQWLDRASSEAIGFAARRLFADPVSILIAIRDEEESPLLAAGLPELRLSGLDHASATALLEQAAPGQVSSERADWMLNATGGNPLALLELGRESPHVSTSPHDTLPIATSVERAYLRRADGLSESARRVLLVVAASGTPELRLVQAAAAALGLSPSDVEEAEAARGLVNQRSQRIEFVHPLARAAIYHSASPADRRAAHKALANVMSGADDVDRRAWHLAAAASGWDADAAAALEGAAQRARQSTGYAAAASAWTESARLTEPPELVRPDDPPEFAVFAHVAYGALAILAGHESDGPKHLHESVRLLELVPVASADPLVLLCAGLVGLFLREAEAGRDLLDRALDQAREHAPTAALPAVLFMLGRDAAATDRWELARAHYDESARVARETTQFTFFAGSTAGLAWLDALEGRADECRAHAAEALELAERYGMGFYKAWSMIALGQLELGLGRPDAALGQLMSCEAFLAEISINDPDLSPAPDIVDALVRLGRLPEAREVADRYQPTADAKGQPFALARAARARALLAGDDRYVEEYQAAIRYHEATPDIFERARTQLYFGERLRRKRRRVEARQQLRAALKAFDQLGAAPWSERAMTELQASGETARVRDDRYRQQLTPQELQVAVTLAEGATTREAAARLYLSPKTVEYHLRHVYDKLEIRSRDELRTVLVAQSNRASSRKALLFTDLAGSTSLVEAIGDAAWRDLSAWMDAELRRCFLDHRGREVDHAGDGFFVVFDAAGDAIECAVSIQRRLLTHRRLHGYAPQVRIGIHVGEVQLADSSVRGAAVHRAARLCAAADADRILVSREALEAGGRPLNGLRKLELKGIKEPVEAAEVRWEG